MLTATVLIRVLFPKFDPITIGELKNLLKTLADAQNGREVAGIISTDTDCVYFICKNQLFDIDYEAMLPSQLPFLDRLEKYAKNKGFSPELTTYGNQPQYESDDTAPVLRIIAGATLDQAESIGREIQSTIFENSDDTLCSIVP